MSVPHPSCAFSSTKLYICMYISLPKMLMTALKISIFKRYSEEN